MRHPGSPYGRKIRRAEQHLREIEAELGRYQESKPCVAVRDRQTNPNPRLWVYRAKFIEQPSEDLPLMIGDFVHNLRSSLDHLMAALNPVARRRNVFFPTHREDIWSMRADPSEEVKRSEKLLRYESVVRDIHPEAQTVVKGLQPYFEPYPAHIHPLAILNALDNADKHYDLVALSVRIVEPTTMLISTDPAFTLVETAEGGSLRDGGVVASFGIRPSDLKAYGTSRETIEAVLRTLASGEADVDVKFAGTIKVAIPLAGGLGYLEIPTALRELLGSVQRFAIEPLEPYIVVP